jgi:hypothetical protein
MIEKHLIFLFFFLMFLECNVKNMDQDTFNKVFIISFIVINNIYVITKYSSIDNDMDIKTINIDNQSQNNNEYSDWILCDVD